MFNIYNIFAGWMAISFGERKEYYEGYTAPDEDMFHLSYLDYVKEDLDYLFNLSNHELKEREFDLEGEDIRISTSLKNDSIHILVEYLYLDEGEEKKYEYDFPYIDFLQSYTEEMIPNEENYKKNFAYHEPDFEWNTDDWKQILEKIKK